MFADKQKLTRRGFLGLAAATAGSAIVLAACARPTATPPPPTTKPPATAAVAEPTKPPATAVPTAVPPTVAPKPLKFTYLRPAWQPPTHQKGSAYELELFKRANVEIEPQVVPVGEYNSKFPVLIAGGTTLDVMWHRGPQSGTVHDLLQQGTFLPLNDLLDKYPAVRNAVGDTLWTLTRSADGKNYFFPNPLAPYVPFPISYRADIYDQLGLKEPSSLAEFADQLKTIRGKMPKMIPLTGHQYTLWYFQNVAVAHGYAYGNWMPDEGQPEDKPAKIVPAIVRRGYRDFLAFVQMLRKENLIDPDYLIAKGIEGINKFRAGEAVTMVGHWYMLPEDNLELRKVVPAGDISFMKQIKGPVGPMGALTLEGFDRGFALSSKSKDKADGIFQFLNWVYTDGYEFMRYGVEGKTYKLDAEGTKIVIPDSERGAGWHLPDQEAFGFPLKTADTWPDWKTMRATYAKYNILPKFASTVQMYVDAATNAMPNWNHLTYSKTNGEKGGQISEQYINPMEGKLAIDPAAPLTLWDEAIKKWRDNGGDKIIEEVNAAQPDKSPIKPKYQLPADTKI